MIKNTYLDIAENDLQYLESLLEIKSTFYNQLAVQCQQVAEKFLKGYLDKILVDEDVSDLLRKHNMKKYVNIVPSYSNRDLPKKKYRICANGCELLIYFLISTFLSIACLIAAIWTVFRDNKTLWLLDLVCVFVVEAIVFWNGIIRVYLSSSQIGIKWRAIGILCGWIPAELEAAGATIYYGNHQSAASVADSGKELADRIIEIVRETGCQKVNIIAHSKGGLDSRYAISRLGMDKYVASLITINTPHRGCVFADYLLNKIPQSAKDKVAETSFP